MSSMTELHRQRLQEIRLQKAKDQLLLLRRKLLLLLTFVGLTASFYTWAGDGEQLQHVHIGGQSLALGMVAIRPD